MNEPVDVPAIQLYSKASRSLDCAFGSVANLPGSQKWPLARDLAKPAMTVEAELKPVLGRCFAAEGRRNQLSSLTYGRQDR